MRAIAFIISLLASTAGATTIRSVTLDSLFAEADVVALIEIRGGDLDACTTGCLYRATVLESFKGSDQGATIYFGPYMHYGIGKKYIAFLSRRGDKTTLGCSPPIVPDPETPCLQVMYSGFSIMEVGYTCDWKTHRDTPAHGCDDGVRVEYKQVVLPHGLSAEPIACGSFNSGWVRLAGFMSVRDARKLIHATLGK